MLCLNSNELFFNKITNLAMSSLVHFSSKNNNSSVERKWQKFVTIIFKSPNVKTVVLQDNCVSLSTDYTFQCCNIMPLSRENL